MRYIIDCPEGIHLKVLQLIAEGRYSTMQDFVLTALQNQLVIEEAPGTIQESPVEYAISGHKGGSRFRAEDLATQVTDSAIWRLSSIRIDTVVPVSNHDAPDENTGWLFGQVNRILPVKFGVRILMALLQGKGQWIPLDWFHQRAADEARKFGKLLEQQDRAHGRSRSDKFSVGFPIGKPSKSLQRYASQFLGYRQPSTGLVIGALPTLYLAVISEETKGSRSIGITEGGLSLGLLPNSVMDEGRAERSMSEEEARQYVQHVCRYAPGEVDALRTILQLIAEGHDHPDAMAAQVNRLFPKWTDAQATTNRSGALGRAWDLDLIDKQRKGSRVRYALSELGRQSLEELNQHRAAK